MIADVAAAFPGAALESMSLGLFLILYAQSGRVRRRALFERGLAGRFAGADQNGWEPFAREFGEDHG